jgi:tetratricopeptide (TPR) repeat protein
MTSLKRSVIAFSLALFAGAPAIAQTPGTDAGTTISVVTIETCSEPSIVPQEADDQALFDRAMQGFAVASFPALRVYIQRFEVAISHAPDCYPQVEQRGDNIIIRTSDTDDYLTLSVATAVSAGGGVSIAQARNTYVEIALLLGSYANENGDYETGLAWLDRAVRWQPRNQHMVMERAQSLIGLRRHADVHEALQAALNDPEMTLTLDRARFLRNDGIVLIDLNRLDEAEAALNESIRLQPNNPVARSELEYIADLRAGRRTAAPAGITAPNAPQPRTQ